MSSTVYQPHCIAIMLIGLMLNLSGCKKADDIRSSPVKPEVTIPEQVGSTARIKVLHLYKDTVYVLNSTVEREAGEQLIIDAGVLIKVKDGNVLIKPGGIITASGTEDAPIVFTSYARAGTQGNNWGGISINGRSFNNSTGGTGVADDFSGVLNYVRIEFASLELKSVGMKTQLSNIMVSYSGPRAATRENTSAFTIEGGNFNAKNLVAYASGGPADYYINNGYSGNLQNIISCRYPFFGTTGAAPAWALAGVYVENNRDHNLQALPVTNPVISNLTVIGPGAGNGVPSTYLDTNLRTAALVTVDATRFHIRNSIFLNYPSAGWYLADSITATNLLNGKAEFNYSVVHSNNTDRAFYLEPGTVKPYTSADFRTYILAPSLKNQQFNTAEDFKLNNISEFDAGPNLQPGSGSPLRSGGSFTNSTFYSDPFFNSSATYIGAIGPDNWLRKWTNFTPLKTNYNFAE